MRKRSTKLFCNAPFLFLSVECILQSVWQCVSRSMDRSKSGTTSICAVLLTHTVQCTHVPAVLLTEIHCDQFSQSVRDLLLKPSNVDTGSFPIVGTGRKQTLCIVSTGNYREQYLCDECCLLVSLNQLCCCLSCVSLQSNVTRKVAVKSLKDGVDPHERLLFLQEAAIMGQFRHRNLVRLYGVVTQGEAVSLQPL